MSVGRFSCTEYLPLAQPMSDAEDAQRIMKWFLYPKVSEWAH